MASRASSEPPGRSRPGAGGRQRLEASSPPPSSPCRRSLQTGTRGAVAADLRVFVPSADGRGVRIPGLQNCARCPGRPRRVGAGASGVRNTGTGAPVADDTIFGPPPLTIAVLPYYVMKTRWPEGAEPRSAARPKSTSASVEDAAIHGPPALTSQASAATGSRRSRPRHGPQHSAGFPHGESGKPFPRVRAVARNGQYSATSDYLPPARWIEHLKGGTPRPR